MSDTILAAPSVSLPPTQAELPCDDGATLTGLSVPEISRLGEQANPESSG